MLFMKKICLLMIMQIAVCTVFAQKHEPVNMQRPDPVNPAKDVQEYQGYTIRLMPALTTPQSMGSYGFDILKDDKPVVHTLKSPLITQKELQKKDDAFKVAQWMIREYNRTGHWQISAPAHSKGIKNRNSLTTCKIIL